MFGYKFPLLFCWVLSQKPKKKQSLHLFPNHTCEVIKSTIKATRSSGSRSSKCFQTSVMYRSAPSNPGAKRVFPGTGGWVFCSWVPFKNDFFQRLVFVLKGRKRTETLKSLMNKYYGINKSGDHYISMCIFNWAHVCFFKIGKKTGNHKHTHSKCNETFLESPYQTQRLCRVQGWCTLQVLPSKF